MSYVIMTLMSCAKLQINLNIQKILHSKQKKKRIAEKNCTTKPDLETT